MREPRLFRALFLARIVLRRTLSCRGNFLFPNPGTGPLPVWNGSSPRLERFWARYPVFRAEQANHQFSVIAGEGPSSVNKVLSGTPLPDCGSGLVLNDFFSAI